MENKSKVNLQTFNFVSITSLFFYHVILQLKEHFSIPSEIQRERWVPHVDLSKSRLSAPFIKT